MKLYISGPMTGLAGYNILAFRELAGLLRGMGHEIINPAELEPPRAADETEESHWTRCILRDLAIILTDPDLEALVVMPGWQQSRGAQLEVAAALMRGLPILAGAEFKLMPIPVRMEWASR